MKGNLAAVLLSSLLLPSSGCSLLVPGVLVPQTTVAHFYPIAGPLAARNPVPAIKAESSGNLFFENIEIALPDGEHFTGKSRQVSPGESVNNDLAPSWDLVFGAGHCRAVVLGAPQHRRATMIGDRGTTLAMETASFESAGSGEGVAQDSKGNVYKIGQ